MRLFEKLSLIQRELKAPKNQYNSFGGYKYRSCEDILEAVKPMLDGLVLTVSDDVVLVGDRVYIKATATITDGVESFVNTALAREPLAKKGMDESQVTGTASSYARKYALNGLFCIDDTKDADSMDNRDSEKKQETKTPAQKSAQTKAENKADFEVRFEKAYSYLQRPDAKLSAIEDRFPTLMKEAEKRKYQPQKQDEMWKMFDSLLGKDSDYIPQFETLNAG